MIILSEIPKIKYLNNDEIVDIIKNYVDKSSYKYSVLINGEWGTGKSHLIKNTIVPALMEHEKSKKDKYENYKEKKVFNITLYGVSSKDEITRQLLVESLPFKGFFKNKGVAATASIVKTAIGGAMSYKGISLPFKVDDINNLLLLRG